MELKIEENSDPERWYVMRDLKRANAKLRAYKMLSELGFEVFTPLKHRIVTRGGKKIRENAPVIQDLLFVHSTRSELDRVVERTETLQYRFAKGSNKPMVVPTDDMNRFITVVNSVETPKYYKIEELTPSMYGSRIRLIGGGTLDGQEGILLKVRGSRKKRLLVELPGLLAAAIEITAPSFVTLP